MLCNLLLIELLGSTLLTDYYYLNLRDKIVDEDEQDSQEEDDHVFDASASSCELDRPILDSDSSDEETGDVSSDDDGGDFADAAVDKRT